MEAGTAILSLATAASCTVNTMFGHDYLKQPCVPLVLSLDDEKTVLLYGGLRVALSPGLQILFGSHVPEVSCVLSATVDAFSLVLWMACG